MKRAYQAALVAAFLVMCCVPGAVMLLKPEDPHLWNVQPVPYPPFEPKASWAPAFEKYFVANLGLKRQLVQLHNALGYRVLTDLQGDSVLVGKKRWLFLRQDFGWQAFRSEDRLSPAAEQAWGNSLRGAKRYLDARGTPMVRLIPPSKESVYPEFLPRSATRSSSFTRLDEMLEIFKETGTDYIDLRDPLRKAREKSRVYDRLDSHWNGRGAEIGARLLMQRVAQLLERPASYAELDARLVPSEPVPDLVLILALQEYVKEPSIALVPNQPRARRLEPPESVAEPTLRQQTRMVFQVDDPSLPSALILCDSFAHAMMPVLVEKFRRSVWLRSHRLDLRLVAREQPDIVIVEMTERFFADAPARLVIAPRQRNRR